MSSSTTRTLHSTSGSSTRATHPPEDHLPAPAPGADPTRQMRIGRSHARTAIVGLAFIVSALGTFWSAAAVEAAPRSRTASERTTLQLEASYHLKASLHYDAARIDVVETVTIVNRASSAIDALHLSVLARAYGEFRSRSVRIDGRPTRVTWPDRADMRVALPSPLQPDEETTLVIRFSDHPSNDARDSLRTRLSKAEGMMRVSDWFPILSTGHGLRNPGDSQVSAAATSITLDLTTDRKLTVAAPGKLIEHEGRRRVYRLDDARNYGFVVAPRLHELVTTTRDGVRVRVFHPAGVAGKGALREARRALERYDDAFGPYPWPELIVAPTPGGWVATEWPSIVFLGSETYANADVVHHEVAHQWFYALLGNDQLREPWVDEAFAMFSERYFFHSRNQWSFCSRKPVDSAVYAFPDTFERWACGGYVETVYYKGAAMIDGVRARMGNKAFFASMRAVIADHRFGLAAGDDVVAAWLSHSRRPQELRQWLGRFLSKRTMNGLPSRGRDRLASGGTALLSASAASNPNEALTADRLGGA
jgi:aminopeptidase N